MCSGLRPAGCRFISLSFVCQCGYVVVGLDVTLAFVPTRWHCSTLSWATLAFHLGCAKHKHTCDFTDCFSLLLTGCGCVRSRCLLQCVLCSSSQSPFCPTRCCSPSHRATTCSGSMDLLSTVHNNNINNNNNNDHDDDNDMESFWILILNSIAMML